jgi:hypothetical protein
MENRLSEYVETTPDVPSIFDNPDIFPRSVGVHLISQNLKDPDHPPLIRLAPINPVYSGG